MGVSTDSKTISEALHKSDFYGRVEKAKVDRKCQEVPLSMYGVGQTCGMSSDYM